jgi:hypothetical protein
MSRELLSTWLDVPAAPWPPDHYALLGLSRGQGDTEEIEQRVLERMEKLRNYQLMHPELVTEGMNLLAQAMVCLTDPKSRDDYDRKLGLAPRETIPSVIILEEEEEAPVVPAIEVAPPPPRKSRPPEPGTPTVYALDEEQSESEALPDAILIPEFVEEPLPLPPEEDAEESDDETYTGVAEEFRRRPELDEEPEPDEREWDEGRAYRRGLYAELVRLRRVLHLWEQVRAYLDDPEKTFARRTDTIAFIARLTELRPLLDAVAEYVGGTNQPGSLLAMLTRQQLGVDTFRSLLPSQRDALAKDCRSAHYVLEDEYRRLRKYVRSLNVKGFKRRVWRPFLRQLVARPEWLLLFFGVVALVVAFVRSVPP